MTKLFPTIPAPKPVSIPPPPEDEPTSLELQRWEDDGGAVLPDATNTAGKTQSVTPRDLDRAAA